MMTSWKQKQHWTGIIADSGQSDAEQFTEQFA